MSTTVAKENKQARYQVYKSSGVEWLGELPAHWEADRLKWTVTMCRNGIWGDEPDGVNDIACVRVADFDRTRFLIQLEKPTIRAVAPSQRTGRVLSKGDLLLEKSGGGELQPVGAVMLFDHDREAVCSNFVARMPVATGFDGRFLAYFHAHLYSGRVNTRSIKQTTGIQNLDSDSYLNELVPFVPFLEQQAIVTFLDRETARIDELIAKKQRLIELLPEKRTALISHAVTKGLNPNAKMKESGLVGLSNIPIEYVVLKLKRVSSIIDGDRGAEYPNETDLLDSGIPFLSSKNIVNNRLDMTGVRFISKDKFRALGRGKLEKGDLIITVRGTIGNVAYFPGEPHTTGFINAQMMILRPRNRVLSSFLHYVALSDYWLSQLDVSSYGTAQQQLSNDILANAYIALPPMVDQQAIVGFLDSETRASDALIGHIQNGLDTLREYRSALISAAVTGKIDVSACQEADCG